ncbi:MAG: Hsp20/alpha crystallin family protein [Gammaproteobacteria bacterium]|nr:MAG: Hsp20/alpha crystallin family protein [Gammaproteobacteria bacterium]
MTAAGRRKLNRAGAFQDMPFSHDLLILTRRVHLTTERRVQSLRWTPAADVYEGRDGWLIKLELAGVRPQDVQLRVCGNFLGISGRRLDLSQQPGLRLRSMEIAYAEFERGFEFPVSIEQAEIRSQFQDGMMLVEIVPGSSR